MVAVAMMVVSLACVDWRLSGFCRGGLDWLGLRPSSFLIILQTIKVICNCSIQFYLYFKKREK
jgi:hypothetical protein